ncbi:hypothetical protein [Tuanshanicoccus yangjingiae]
MGLRLERNLRKKRENAQRVELVVKLIITVINLIAALLSVFH